jgi:hypothetical protein
MGFPLTAHNVYHRMRLPITAHSSRPWRIHEVARDFRIPRHPQGRTGHQRPRPAAPPPALRPPRQQRQDDHPQRRPDAPPRHRHSSRPHTRPRPRRRPPHHRHRPRHRRGPLHPPHRGEQDLLAQPTTRARPLAEPLQARPMTRLIWDPCPDSSQVELGGLEPPTSWVRSRRAPALSLACLLGYRGCGGSV